MESYCTSGINKFTNFQLPLFYTAREFLAEKEKERFQLLFIEEGNLLLQEKRKTLSILPPAILLIDTEKSVLKGIYGNSDKLHNMVFRPESVNSRYPFIEKKDETGLFYFDPFRNTGENGYLIKSLSPEIRIRLKYLLEKLDETLNRQESDYWPCLSRSYLIEILILIYRIDLTTEGKGIIPLPDTGTDTDPLFIYLHTHYSEKITVETLASRFATNRTSLNNTIREHSGLSAKAYLNYIRLEVAASLLRNTELSVSEISDRIGIEDIAYFSRSFKKKNGLSPSEFRGRYPSPY